VKGKTNPFRGGIHTFKFHSLFSRFFISYLSILLVVIATMCSAYFYLRGGVMQKEIDAGEDYLSYVYIIVDGELNRIREMMDEFFQNPAISPMLASPKDDDVYDQRRISGALSDLIGGSKFIDGCFLYSKESRTVISNGGTISKEDFLDFLSSHYITGAGEIAEMLNESRELRIMPGQTDGADTPRIHARLPYVTTTDSKIALISGAGPTDDMNRLVVLVNEMDIRDILLKTNILNYGSVYIVDGRGNVVSSSAGAGGPQFDPALFTVLQTRADDTLQYDGNLVLSKRSDILGGYYITLLPYESIFEKINMIRDIFIISLLILSGICILFALLYSRAFYNPVLKLVEKLAARQPVDVKGKNEFALINHWVEHIQLNSERSREAEALERMIETGFQGDDAAQMFPYGKFLVAVLIGDSALKGAGLISEYVRRHPLEDAVLKFTKGNEGYCCLICNGNDLDAQRIQAYLMAMKRRIERDGDCFLVVGMSELCDGLAQVSQSFKNALDAIRLGVCEDENCFFEYSRRLKPTCKIYFPTDFDQKITDVLVTGSPEKIAGVIAGVFEHNKAVPRIYMRTVYMELINAYTRVADKYGRDYPIVEVVQYIENEYRPSHVMRFLTELYCSLLPGTGIPQDTTERVEDFILAYIEKNYHDENVNIEDIAEKLRLSRPYVSTLFKRSTGVAFSQYLMEFRINKAKELLLGTDYPVKVVASRVGYGTHTSFTRSFSKAVGISPEQFRVTNALQG